MRAFGEEAVEPRFGFRRGIGARNAGDVEAAFLRFREKRYLDVSGSLQKSRST